MNEKGCPKLIQHVVKNDWTRKKNGKYTLKTMQNVVQQ